MEITSNERELLRGLLAVHRGRSDSRDVLTAVEAWMVDPSRPIGQRLLQLDAIDAATWDELEAELVQMEESREGRDDSTRPLKQRGPADGEPNDTSLAPTVARDGDGPRSQTPAAADHGSWRRFVIGARHARGGLGEVHRAVDRELHREVAIKTIRPQGAGDAANRERFVFEGRITGSLEHPGIVPIYSMSHNDRGEPFYAMRFVRGQTLQQAVDSFHSEPSEDPGARRLELRRLLDHFIDVCRITAYAHSRGVLHRDIKPANIIAGEYGETLLVDWGLAKATDVAASGPADSLASIGEASPHETQQGSIVGTPAFMSPEQATGDLESHSERTDVYGLGATLYYVLTGKAAFDSSSGENVLEAVRRGEFPAPRTRDAGIPRPLAAICLQAMALQPEKRYPSAESLAVDVERWLADEPVSAWREPMTIRVRRWMRRHRTLMTATAVAGAMALIALTGIAAVESQARRRLDAKNAELAEARDRAETRASLAIRAVGNFRDAVEDNMDVELRPELADVRTALLKGPLEFFSGLKQDLQTPGDATPATREQLAEAYVAYADLTRRIGSQDDARAAYQDAEELLRRLIQEDAGNLRLQSQLADIAHRLGDIERDLQSSDQALQQYRRAEQLRRDLIDRRSDDQESRRALASILQRQAQVLSLQGDRPAAVERCDEGLSWIAEALDRAPGDAQAQLTQVQLLDYRASLAERLGQPRQALDFVQRGLETVSQLLAASPESIDHRRMQARLSTTKSLIQLELEDQSSAAASQETSLEIRRRLAEEFPTYTDLQEELARSLIDMSRLQFRSGRIGDSAETLQEARQLIEDLIARQPSNMRIRDTLVDVLLRQGNNAYMSGDKNEALNVFQQLIPVTGELLALDPGDARRARAHAGIYYNVGVLSSDMGRFDEARAAYESALRLRKELAEAHPQTPQYRNDVAFTLGNMAVVAELTLDFEASIGFSRAALAIQQQLVEQYREATSHKVNVGRTLRNLGATQTLAGRLQEAVDSFSQAAEVLEPLADQHANDTQYRRDLIELRRSYADALLGLRQFAAARTQLDEALTDVEGLVASRPDEQQNNMKLVRVCAELARLEAHEQRWEAVATQAQRAIEAAVDYLEKAPEQFNLRQTLARTYRLRCESFARRGMLDEAQRDWDDRLTVIDESTAAVEAPFGKALVAAWSGDHSAAAKLLSDLNPPDNNAAGHCFQRAIVGATAAAVCTDQEHDVAVRYTTQAIADLAAAADLNAFDEPATLSKLTLGRDLDVLRDQPEFAALLMRVKSPSGE